MIEWFIDSNIVQYFIGEFNTLIGEFFYNNEERYEGEWKDDKKHGQGKKSDWLNDLLILTLFNTLITGKFFYNNGNRYEGEWKGDNMHGQGKKSDWLNDLLILTLFNSLIIGKYFYDNGERYEGEWEYGMKYG